MFTWRKHYTGISIAELGPLYVQRDTATGAWQFVRASASMRLGAGVWEYYMAGVFIGRSNHLNQPGWEFFTSNGWAGFTYAPQACGVHFSGGSNQPHAAVTLTCGRAFVGMRSPRWLVKLMAWRQRREWAKQEAAYAAYEAQFEQTYGEEN